MTDNNDLTALPNTEGQSQRPVAQVLEVISGDKVEGDKIDGDKVIYNQVERTPTYISGLIIKIREELTKHTDRNVDRICDELQNYLDEDPDKPKLAFEEKMQLGGHDLNQINRALKLKEKFWKKIQQFQWYNASQEFFVAALATALLKFDDFVTPLIDKGKSLEEINEAVHKHVIDEIYIYLEDNPLGIGKPEIKGMIYFMTGNCHICWHKY